MGNSDSDVHPWPQLSILPPDPAFPTLLPALDRTGKSLLVQETQIGEGGDEAMLLRLEKRRSGQRLWPITQCFFEKSSSLCSQQERCLLVCPQPPHSLRALWQARVNENSKFSSFQVNLFLTQTATAVFALEAMHDNAPRLQMEHIFIEDGYYLLDPMMASTEAQTSQQHFPPPENEGDTFEAALFALGVIGLIMYHGNAVSQLYMRDEVGNRKIKQASLQMWIERVQELTLRNNLAILTHNHPVFRRNFAVNRHFKHNEPIFSSPQSFKITCSTNQHSPNDKLLKTPPMSPHAEEQPKLKKPKVCIRFNNTLVQSAGNLHCPSLISTPNASSNMLILNMPDNALSITPKSRNSVTVSSGRVHTVGTPQGRKRRDCFSTIKEVTEDDCMTEQDTRDIDSPLSQNGSRSGWRRVTFPQGSIYEGQWHHGKMHGYGRLFYPNGKLAYDGTWFNDQFHGQGKVCNDRPAPLYTPFNFADLSHIRQEWACYEGNLVQDHRQGWGKLTLSNGQSFEGQFKADQIEGEGIFTTLSGQRLQGIWRDSRLLSLH